MSYARFHLIQVVLDHGLPDPIPVGVLVYRDNKAAVRMVGATGMGDAMSFWTNAEMIRCALPELDSGDWVYENWVDWFDHLVRNFPSDQASCLRELGDLELRCESVIATINGKMEMVGSDTVKDVADHLFDEIIGSKSAFRRARFLSAAKNAVFQSELPSMGGYSQNAEVEVLGADGTPTTLLFFPHFWDFPLQGAVQGIPQGRMAIKLLSFDLPPEEVSASVADASLAFDTAVRERVLTKERCIILHDTPDATQAHYLTLLGGRFKLIDISQEHADFELRSVIIGD